MLFSHWGTGALRILALIGFNPGLGSLTSAASGLRPNTIRRDAQPSGRESTLHNGGAYGRSGREPRRTHVRPTSSDPGPRRNLDSGAVGLSPPSPPEAGP